MSGTRRADYDQIDVGIIEDAVQSTMDADGNTESIL